MSSLMYNSPMRVFRLSPSDDLGYADVNGSDLLKAILAARKGPLPESIPCERGCCDIEASSLALSLSDVARLFVLWHHEWASRGGRHRVRRQGNRNTVLRMTDEQERALFGLAMAKARARKREERKAKAREDARSHPQAG